MTRTRRRRPAAAARKVPPPPPPHTAPPPTPAEAADAEPLFALLDTWAAELRVPVEHVGAELTRAIDRGPAEPKDDPKADEVWVGSPFGPAPLGGAPRQAPTRRALVAALWTRWNTGARDGDLAVFDPYGIQWHTGARDGARWPVAYLYVTRTWVRAEAKRKQIPIPACLAEAVAVTAPAELPPAVEAATPVPAPAPVPIVTVHDERIPLLMAAIKERRWPPLAIPRRGVAALRQALYDEHGWTADMFRGTWEEAGRRKLVAPENKPRYQHRPAR